MQINGSIPIHVARAYGVKPPAAPVPAPAAAKPASMPFTTPFTAPVTAPTPSLAPPAPAPTSTESVSSLVGGRVSRPIDFSAEPVAARSSHAFQLYTRAADKIEAAVAVQIGRTIDVTG